MTRRVTITLLLPADIADQVEEVQKTEPAFLFRVVQAAMVRRGIYREIRERGEIPIEGSDGGAVSWRRVVPIEESEGRRILEENQHHDGGAWSEKDRDDLEVIQRAAGLPVQRRPVR